MRFALSSCPRKGITTKDTKFHEGTPSLCLRLWQLELAIHGPFRVQMLQGMDLHFSALQGGDAFGGRTGRSQSRDRRNSRHYRRATNGFFVEPRLLSGGCVD